uniref:Choline/carnitine acyltransferase domain-containing protein n=2 Tax=Lutzomyia longipalpis TaxID=7200 RepID=A0A1B0CRW5_LUTLO
MPLLPFCGMIHPFNLQSAGIPETHEMSLKTTAWMFYHIMEFWKLLRQERIKSGSTSSAPLTSFLHRRLYNSCRLPGETMDTVWSAFKTYKEGSCPSHSIVLCRGRIFMFDCVDEEGEILTPLEFFALFTAIREEVARDGGEPGAGVAVLTSDNRTNWAINRKKLMELTENNRKVLELIESAVAAINLDDQQPSDYTEVVADIMGGDLEQRWADKSLNYVSFANGKIGCAGEHTCFDGTIAVHLSAFLLESLSSGVEPNWSNVQPLRKSPVELIFDLDDNLRTEITRMKSTARQHKLACGVDYSHFMDFGKEAIKPCKIHPDAFIQLALLLTYHRLHGEFAPTYETALMRNYYKGRTETVRSCSEDAVKWIKCMVDAEVSIPTKAKLFRIAAKRQTQLMNDARSGRGIDRHLFALWCIAYENGFEIPKLYDDPLYSRSGGGGNFILSTSTLGFSVCGGCVAPMCLDEGELLTPLQFFALFTAIREEVARDGGKPGAGVAVLTSDNRTNWAINRKKLMELTENNRKVLELIESAVAAINLDDQQPSDYTEVVADIMGGDLEQRWADKSLNYVSFANGKIGCAGEHTCFDGTIAVHLSAFLLESLSSGVEPNWSNVQPLRKSPVELIFDLDDNLRTEITRMKSTARQHEAIKPCKIHPDAFIQLALLLTYHRLHGEFAPTYETALMRNYYKGRTETVRSCSEDAVKWIKCMVDAEVSIPTKAKLFRIAAKRQTQLMNDARSGRGIDRHLFALGGGGNFILSTSTLGFSVCGGCVAPMCLDGYGTFYNILPNSIILITTVYNEILFS